MSGTSAQLILASASPRRRELLTQIGLRFQICAVDLDESQCAGEIPSVYVQRLALAKAGAAQQRLQTRLPVLGADTCVVIDGHILGKPKNREHALQMLSQLSNQVHSVFSAVAIVQHQHKLHELVKVQQSRVYFRALSAAECETYWQTGEPADKAGSYAIQGIGATFVKKIIGSHSSVMGLPLYETAQLLREFEIDLL